MNISGVIVRTRPERLAEVSARLRALDGVEIHATADDGRMVVTIEEPTGRDPADTLLRMQDLPGVLAASMVYHQFEDDACIDEEVCNETDPA